MAKPKQPRKRKKGASAMFDLGVPKPTVEDAYEIERGPLRDLAFLHRAYCVGSFAALYDALLTCERDGVLVQLWMIRAMRNVMEAVARGELSYGPGPVGNPLARERMSWIHFARYEAVLEVRENQDRYRETVRFLSEEAGLSPQAQKECLLNFRDPGRTWEDAYKCASDLLRGTRAFGAAATIKRSYLSMNRHLKDPEKSANMKVLSSLAMKLFDLRPDEKTKPG